jgi:hypothetical protein
MKQKINIDENTMSVALNHIIRNIIWIVLGILALIWIEPSYLEIRTILYVIFYEALALGLSGIGLYVYTKIRFTAVMLKGNDMYISKDERIGTYRVIGDIVKSVHLLVGLIVLGVYIAQFF